MIFEKLQQNKTIRRLKKDCDKILALEEKFSKLSNDELRDFSLSLLNGKKDKYGQLPQEYMHEAFALVRETTFRALGLKQYPVQIMGGLALLEGSIAEMNTGEGKTLMSYFPAYIRALTGENVHILTSNEYLAKRDAEQASKIFEMLGLSTGVAVSGMSRKEKKQAYSKNITYSTVSEVGFDYLRDQDVTVVTEKVQRGLNYVIVDEADNALLDEASTPLIISGEEIVTDKELIKQCAEFVSELDKNDIEYDDELKSVFLTAEGQEKLERYFGINAQTHNERNIENIYYRVNNALKAEELFTKNKDYAVVDGKIGIIDRYTNRIMPGRMYTRGLHQALEAKEGLEISDQTCAKAQITIGSLVSQYKVKAGMTGTASTDKDELDVSYGMPVVKIPTNKKSQRVDLPLRIFASQEAKNMAVIEDIFQRHEKGQPILIGVSSVEMSRVYEKLLSQIGLEYNVLNAVDHEREDFVVAQAGRKGAITIATNVAGRGTDILLGGNPAFMAKAKLREMGYDIHQIAIAESALEGINDDEVKIKALYKKLKSEYSQITKSEKREVIDAGGLCVIGTELNISRRIDDQLKGRAGRQGDKGESRMYCSLDDFIFEYYGDPKELDILKSKYKNVEERIADQMVKDKLLKIQRVAESKEQASRKWVRRTNSAFDEIRKAYEEMRKDVYQSEDFNSIYQKLFNLQIENEYNREFSKEENNDVLKYDKRIEEMLYKYGIKDEACDEEKLFGKDKETVEELAKMVAKKYEDNLVKVYGINNKIVEFDKLKLLNDLGKMWTHYLEEFNDMDMTAGTSFRFSSNLDVDMKKKSGDMFNRYFNEMAEEYLNENYFDLKWKAEHFVQSVSGLKTDETGVKLCDASKVLASRVRKKKRPIENNIETNENKTVEIKNKQIDEQQEA